LPESAEMITEDVIVQKEESLAEKSDAIDYEFVSYYGLSGNPFDRTTEFFLTQSLSKLIGLINHLVNYSNKLLVVTAPEQGGKATFVNHYCEQLAEQVQVCRIGALQSDTLNQLLLEIADQCSIPVEDSGSAAELIEEFSRYSNLLSETSRSSLIVIEEAHLLNQAVIRELGELVIQNQQKLQAFRVLLVGQPQVVISINATTRAEDGESNLFHYALPEFTREESEEFIVSLFRHGGDEGKNPFKNTDYELIYQESKGLPGKIVSAAQVCLENNADSLLSNNPRNSMPIKLGAVVLGLLAMVGIGVLWTNSPEENDIAEPDRTRVLGQVQREMPHNEETKDSLDTPEIADTTVLSLPQVIQTVESQAGVVEDDHDISENIENLDILAPTKKVDNAELNLEPDVSLAKEESEELLSKAGSGEIETAAGSLYTLDEQRILAFSDSSMTLQLFGTHSRERISELMETLSGSEELMQFQTLHNEAPWFVLIYGNFPDRGSGDIALESLPKEISVLRPWLRGVQAIQADLKARAEP